MSVDVEEGGNSEGSEEWFAEMNIPVLLESCGWKKMSEWVQTNLVENGGEPVALLQEDVLFIFSDSEDVLRSPFFL